MADYLIKHAKIFMPASGSWNTQDIQIQQGHIAKIAEYLPSQGDTVVIDASGKYVSAGWVDAHVHTYECQGAIGVDCDQFLSQGVTYIVDAGTAGPGNFEDYLAHDNKNKKIPQKAYLNLAYMGVVKPYGELTDLTRVDLDACQRMIEKHPEDIIGVKLRIDPRVCREPKKAMELIHELSLRTGKPVIVHASRTELSMETILSFMKKGDVFAHSFADKLPELLDNNGKVKECVWEARKRGVFFDLSHGKSNFSYEVAQKAFDQGFLPDAISTDLHQGSMDVVKSLPLTMSKMMACGLSLEKVLRLVTADAVHMLQVTDKDTEIKEGAKADLTIFQVEKGKVSFTDSDGNVFTGNALIRPYCTILDETIYQR